jgi:hypothetical protein
VRVLTRATVAVAVAAAILLPTAAQAGKQVETATLIVTKVVTGDVPADAEFTIEVTCPFLTGDSGDADIDSNGAAWGDDGAPEGPPFENPRIVTFGPEGGSESLDVFEFAPDCTVTETDASGAETTVYEPGVTDPECTVTASADGALVEYEDAVTCEVVITNDFPEPEPQPAQVVQVGPAFTG